MLPGLLTVGPAMKELPLRCAQVFFPLLFNMDQRPLAAAEGEVLQAGQLEVILLCIDHPMR